MATCRGGATVPSARNRGFRLLGSGTRGPSLHCSFRGHAGVRVYFATDRSCLNEGGPKWPSGVKGEKSESLLLAVVVSRTNAGRDEVMRETRFYARNMDNRDFTGSDEAACSMYFSDQSTTCHNP